MKKTNAVLNFLSSLCLVVVLFICFACEGIDIYDKADDEIPSIVTGQLYMDATSWTDWYYVSLDSLLDFSEGGDSAALRRAQTEFSAWPIPMSGEGDGKSGQYLYWFDVFGKGLSNNEFRSFTPADVQSEPDEWSIAIHRDNVRTNGGAVCETSYTSIDELTQADVEYDELAFTSDEWSENAVWSDQSQMMRCLVASQGIAINKVLSSWLVMSLPPIPPSFTHNNHVFVLQLKNGRYAALQLENFRNPKGTACWLTINYRYPL